MKDVKAGECTPEPCDMSKKAVNSVLPTDFKTSVG